MAPNVNNWARAAQVVTSQNTAIRKKLADDKPRYDRIGQASVQAAAKNAVNVAENNASTADTAIQAEALMRKTKIGIDEDKKTRGFEKKSKMTGMLAGGAALIGYGAMNLNKKEEADPMLAAVKKQVDMYGDRINKANADITKAQDLIDRLKNTKAGDTSSNTPSSNTPSSNSSTGKNSDSNQSSGSGQYAGLQGGAKTLADAIARYESGSWGYEAFNQGGAASGRKVLGKSGSYKEQMGGRSLTDLSLGEIFDKQNTKAKGMSMDEHIKSGGLHAVGRYQFIGSTLQDEVSRMGLSLDTKFTPEIQDKIFLNHIKRVGDISPWVGPSDNYSESEKANFRNIIQGL